MTAITTSASSPALPGDLVQVPRWALAVLVLAAFGSYLLLQENGWIVSNWMVLHELFHDGRHALGFPCH
jgi:cobalt transporter subunit CbtB